MAKKRWEAPVPTAVDKKYLSSGKALEFVRKAIIAGRDVAKGYKGIHSVFSGFNGAIKNQLPGCNPIAITQALAEAGKLVLIPAKKGVMLYLPEDAPKVAVGGASLLAKMGLAPSTDGNAVTL